MMLTLKQQEILKKYRETTEDKAALTIYPFRYEVLAEKEESTWKPKDQVIFQATLISTISTIYLQGRSISRFRVQTQHQEYQCIAFNRPYLRNLKVFVNDLVTIVGQVSVKKEIIVASVTSKPLCACVGIFPVYPLVKGVKQSQIRALIQKVIKNHSLKEYEGLIPKNLQTKYRLLDYKEALIQLHQPSHENLLKNALRTLKYAEALDYHIALSLDKQANQQVKKHHIKVDQPLLQSWLAALPYQLTVDQLHALHEILADLESDQVMRRLLLGDVGSGKTIVALLCAKVMMAHGKQVVFLAPTEVLANQHFQNALKIIDQVYLLTSASTQEQKQQVYTLAKLNKATLFIGTHALFNDDLVFADLGLVIMDEQHRFGVKQRQNLIAKGQAVEVLMLSATPIPRTLAASLYAHLNLSLIETYPSDRGRVFTTCINENSIQSILPFLEKQILKNDQIYFVVSSINEDNKLQTQSVQKLSRNLSKAFPHWKIGFLHSQLSSDEIQNTLNLFREQKLNVLVTTTVIEVGIDIPTANTMVIYNADRFGLSQLHQLRGRIGRGQKDGYCFVLLKSNSDESKQRINYFVKESSGFKLAMADLKQRGSGDLFGVRQSGYPNFTLLDISSDDKILLAAMQDAKQLVEIDHPYCLKIKRNITGYLMKAAI